MSHRVFISHCEADNALALDICHRIESRGVQCWIAPRDVVVGEDYARRIGDAIEQSAAFVVVLSRHTNGSIFVKREVEYACSSKIPIFPVRIEKVELDKGLRLFISINHRVDAFGAGRGRALEQLARAVVRKVQRGKENGGATDNIRELARMIGPGAMDFIRQWKRMDETRAPLAWSWEAFLGGALWPFYRGMIGLGAVLVAVLVIMMLLGGTLGRGVDGALTGLLASWLLIAFYVGLTGSVALRRHARRMVASGERPSRPKRLVGMATAAAAVAGALAAAVATWPGPAAAPAGDDTGGDKAGEVGQKTADAKDTRRRPFEDIRRAEREKRERDLDLLGAGYVVGRIDQAQVEADARAAEAALTAGNAASAAIDPSLPMTNGM
jgi:Spy/CpxP family protein refolding chaperone